MNLCMAKKSTKSGRGAGRPEKWQPKMVTPSGHTLIRKISGGKNPKWEIKCGSCGTLKVLYLTNAIKRPGCGCKEQSNRDQILGKFINALPERTREEIAQERTIGRSVVQIAEHFKLQGPMVKYGVARITKAWRDTYKASRRSNPGLVAATAMVAKRDGAAVAKDTFCLNDAQLRVVIELAAELKDKRNAKVFFASFDESSGRLREQLANGYEPLLEEAA